MDLPDIRVDLDGEVPVYRQIADGIREAVSAERISFGARLPATRDLARQLGINRNTVIAAYDFLASEGWVHSHTGRGTFLAAGAPGAGPEASAAVSAEAWFTGFSREAEGAVASGLQAILRLVGAPEGISFVASHPTPDLMPVEEFRRSLGIALDERGSEVLGYGRTSGDLLLRKAIAQRMRIAGSRAGEGDLLITNGAQQGLELVFRCFLDAGDVVVTEEPTYTGALSVLGALGARIVGVPVDEQGIRPDLLAIALQRHRPKLIYVQPTFQNPTTALMGESRRRQVLAVAARFRCPVVEDDWAGDLAFDESTHPTLHALDGGKHVIYLSTFSKQLMPGLRVGWVAAPSEVRRRLVELKRIEDFGTSPLIQAALEVYLREGGLEKHLSRVRPVYRERRDRMIGALERHFPARVGWSRPEGGLFLWVTLPPEVDGAELFVEARQRGVLYSRGELFHSTPATGRNTFRLTYSAASPSQIDEGVATLGELVSERLDRSRGTREESTEAMPIL